MEHHSLSTAFSCWTGLPHNSSPEGLALTSLLTEIARVGPPKLPQCTHPTTASRGSLSLSCIPCPPSRESSQGARIELDMKDIEGHGVWAWNSWPERTNWGCFCQGPSHPRASLFLTSIEAPNEWTGSDSSSSPRNCTPIPCSTTVLHKRGRSRARHITCCEMTIFTKLTQAIETWLVPIEMCYQCKIHSVVRRSN